MRALLAFFLAFAASVALADNCTQFRGFAGSSSGVQTEQPWRATVAEACADAVGRYWNTTQIATSEYYDPPNGISCRFKRADGNVLAISAVSYRTGNYCNLNPCQQGLTEKKLIRLGWARAQARADFAPWKTTDGRGYYSPASSADQFPGDKPLPTDLCDGTCQWVIDGAPADWWIGEDPATNGLHPIYREQGYMSVGAQCTAKTPEADPAAPGPQCDGVVGQVNGKATCIAKEAPNTVRAYGRPKVTASGAGQKPTPSTNPDGSGKSHGPNGENPGKPGDRPGLVDLGGTGVGASGTPSKDADGKATGTVSKPAEGEEQAECGAPGQPACRIDESGTPDGKGLLDDGFNTSRDSLLESAKTNRDKIAGKDDKDGFFSFWFFFFVTPPPVLCGPIKWGDLVDLDPCPVADGMRTIMAFIWALGGFWLCVGFVREAV